MCPSQIEVLSGYKTNRQNSKKSLETEGTKF